MVTLGGRHTFRTLHHQKLIFHVFAIKIETTLLIWLKYKKKMSKIFHDPFQMETFGEYEQITFDDKVSCSEGICPREVNYYLNFAM